MRVRYVSNSRARVRIFTNDVSILTHLHRRLIAEGFKQVSFIKFWIHVLTAGKKGYEDNQGDNQESEPIGLGVYSDDSARN